MRRIGLMGLALVAVLVLIAPAASHASGGAYYWCKPRGTGEYTTSSCTTKAAQQGEGEYELVPVAACEAQDAGAYTNSTCTVRASTPDEGTYEQTHGRAYTSTGGSAELATPAFGDGKVACTASTGVGEITGEKAGVDRLTFTGCSFEGLECESAGPNGTPSGQSGVIVTNLLDTRLVENPETITFVNAETNETETKGPASGELWEELLSSEHEPYASEFNCGGVVYLRTKGQDTGVLKIVNRLSTSQEVGFENGLAADGLLTEALTESGWVGPAPSSEEAGVATVTNESAIEARAKAAGLTCTFPYCEPTITPGVRIYIEKQDADGDTTTAECAAGPLMVAGNATYLLTAGHCFAEKFGEQGTFTDVKVRSEYPSGGGLKDIGTGGWFIDDKKFDIAEIKVNQNSSGPWTEALPTPVPAKAVEWFDKPNERPVKKPQVNAVTGEAPSKAAEMNCREGGKTGERCGEVEQADVDVTGGQGDQFPAHLDEDSAYSEKGDSGGPFLSHSGAGAALMQGTLVGEVEETITLGGALIPVALEGDKIKNVPEGVLKLLKDYKIKKRTPPLRPTPEVRVIGNLGKVPVNTFVEAVGKEVTMTNAATGNGNETIYFERKASFYEPMEEILKVPQIKKEKQTLLKTSNEKR